MENIQIQTTQNIELNYELAGVGDRLIASVIDGLIQIGYIIALALVLNFLSGIGFSPGLFVGILFYLPIFLYDVILESFYNGQSFGKKLRHIQVIKVDGTEASIGSYIIRWLFRLFEITLSMGSVALFTLIIGGKGQRLGDMAAGTTVVRLKKRVRLEDTILAEIDADYTPVFKEAVNLSHRDIETIKEVLRAQPEEDRHGIIKMEFIKKTATIIKNKLAIASTMESRTFLSTIIKDYNFLNGRVS